MRKHTVRLILAAAAFCIVVVSARFVRAEPQRRLYVASPGIRDYLEYGGYGVLVYDIDHGHKWMKRISLAAPTDGQAVENIKGICASAATGRLYVSNLSCLKCLDLINEKLVWSKAYEGGCDRMSISPDGKIIYLPTLEKNFWHVVDANNGDVIARIQTNSGAHNTVYGADGHFVYMAGLKSPLLRVADTRSHTVARMVGPFGDVIRPFTVNGSQTLCFVCVNELLGFEVGDLATGKMLHRVQVQGFKTGPVKRHGCPSHGIGLTPDEKELWLADSFNCRLHIFDTSAMPPKPIAAIATKDLPGWITFSIDGSYAYPSTGDVIETKSRKIVAELKDENGKPVQSEKLLEIDFDAGKPVRAGDQFGVGRVFGK